METSHFTHELPPPEVGSSLGLLAAVAADVSGVIVRANRPAEGAFGAGRAGLRGRGLAGRLSDETRHRLAGAIRASSASSDGSVERFEAAGVTDEGPVFPVDISLQVDRSKGRDLTVAVVRDLRLQQRLHDDLAASEVRFTRLVGNASEVVYALDASGTITSINRACASSLGYSAQELIGRRIADLVDPAEVADSQRRVTRRREGHPEEQRYDRTCVRKDGGRVLMELSTRLGFDATGVHSSSASSRRSRSRRSADWQGGSHTTSTTSSRSSPGTPSFSS